jgi:hypothetical protein
MLAEPEVMEFGGAYGADRECYYMVLSLSREPDETKRLIFKDLTQSEMEQIKRRGQFEQGKLDSYGIPFVDPEDVLNARIYWELFADTIHKVTGRKKMFSGAFGGPELSVRFMPLAVLPHANYVAWSSGICSDNVRELRRILREKMRGCRRIKPGLYPHVAVYRIQSGDDLRRVIEYIFKPVAVAFAYNLVAPNLDGESKRLARLNEQVNLFLENIEGAFSGMHRMKRYGCCNPSSGRRNYIGVVTQERRERRVADAVRRAKKKSEDEAMKECFPGYKPHKRRKTQQERDSEFLKRACYRKMVSEGEIERPPRRGRVHRKS